MAQIKDADGRRIPEWPAAGPGRPPPYLIVNDYVRCRMCKLWATDEHLTGRQHIKNVKYYVASDAWDPRDPETDEILEPRPAWLTWLPPIQAALPPYFAPSHVPPPVPWPPLFLRLLLRGHHQNHLPKCRAALHRCHLLHRGHLRRQGVQQQRP